MTREVSGPKAVNARRSRVHTYTFSRSTFRRAIDRERQQQQQQHNVVLAAQAKRTALTDLRQLHGVARARVCTPPSASAEAKARPAPRLPESNFSFELCVCILVECVTNL